MYVPATDNVIVIYHVETEEVRALWKNVQNVNDPCWLNHDPDSHAMMHIHPDEYNLMDHHALQAHHKMHIPIHKKWFREVGHAYWNDQKTAADEYRKHLRKIGK